MAATEQEEKYQRRQLMEKLKCSELEVVEHIAGEMMKLGIGDRESD
jgi:hypothetical protein